MSDSESLITDPQRRAFREIAASIEGIDSECYARCGRDPLEPIAAHGDLQARIGFFGRDPGRDEVLHGEPFIGAGGQLVRRALYRHHCGGAPPDFAASRAIGRHFFWANTVPYKPAGNKAWSMKVKKRCQPLIAQLLADSWQGADLITFGREAFQWFGIHQSAEVARGLTEFWAREDRFEQAFELRLCASGRQREIRLHPLPHPSPLNARWYGRLPGLIAARLQQLEVAQNSSAQRGIAARSKPL